MSIGKYLKNVYMALVACTGVALVFLRRESIFGPAPTSVDLLLIALTSACLLFPVVKEISLGGVTLKREIENTKKEINDRLNQVRNEIVSSVAVSPTFNLGAQPLTDETLKKLEISLEQTVNNAFQSFSQPGSSVSHEISVEDETMFLFTARHNIERELRRIWGNRDFRDSRWPSTVHYMVRNLADEDVIPRDFVHAIKEVYNVCSPAIHGEEATPQQVAFVKDLSPKIIATLRNIV